MPSKIPKQSPNENRCRAGAAWRCAGLGFAGDETAGVARSNFHAAGRGETGA